MDFWLAADGGDVALSVLDQEREVVARVPASSRRGINRVSWNLRHTDPGQEDNETPSGPLVVPGHYIVRLEVNGTTSENTLEVREDPRIQVDAETRRQWTEDLMTLGALARAASDGADEMEELAEKVESESSFPETLTTWATDLLRQWKELQSRTRSLAREIEGWVGHPTQDQLSRQDYYQEMVETLGREAQAIAERIRGASPLGGQR
jgi:hypothetical protein